MALIADALVEALRRPTVGSVAVELAVLAAPLWIAALVGLFLGWAWRPSWAAGLAGKEEEESGRPPSLGLALGPSRSSSSAEIPKSTSVRDAEEKATAAAAAVVTDEDLHHLCRLVEATDGGPAWRAMMERLLPAMSYQAWQRDPPSGPPQFRSSTVFEDATPEIVRDFFWDDEFRIKNGWDDMLLNHSTLEACQSTGEMMVQWIRKFPFFCSNREYIIGRRIWESKGTFYCVTKGVPCSSVPRRNKPRRVDLYYSSWCIRPAPSKRDGQMSACEVLLFHHEDMGIPWEIVKLGAKQGMWGCVKKIEPALRAYQTARAAPMEEVSPSAAMAQITTKFDAHQLRLADDEQACSSSDIVEAEKPKHVEHWASNLPKFLVLGGAVALACSLDHGLLGNALLFGVGRRFAKQGKRLK